MKARIFLNKGDGKAIATEYAQCTKTGAVTKEPIKGRVKEASISSLVSQGFPIAADLSQLNQVCMNQENGFAVAGAETAQGARVTTRIESNKKVGAGKGTKRINITLQNTSTGTDSSILIGDAIGIIARSAAEGGLGIGAKPAAVTVAGKWGSGTLDVLKLATGYASHDLHSVHIEATNISDGSPNTSYRTSGRFQMVKATPNGDAPSVHTYELFPLVTQDSYNRNIFEIRDFREQVGPYDGILIFIPFGVRVDISFVINAVGTGAVMELV